MDSIKLGEDEKMPQVQVNTGNTGVFVASYAGGPSSREWGVTSMGSENHH